MDFLIISGAPGTGKTTSVNLIGAWLFAELAAVIDLTVPMPTFQRVTNENGDLVFLDISIVVYVNNKKIILHSATDDHECIDNLFLLLNSHTDADIVITTCRDIGWERDYFNEKIRNNESDFYLEAPCAKITRRNNEDRINADNWYDETKVLLHSFILMNNPYNLFL